MRKCRVVLIVAATDLIADNRKDFGNRRLLAVVVSPIMRASLVHYNQRHITCDFKRRFAVSIVVD
jgi:hypothetical protein